MKSIHIILKKCCMDLKSIRTYILNKTIVNCMKIVSLSFMNFSPPYTEGIQRRPIATDTCNGSSGFPCPCISPLIYFRNCFPLQNIQHNYTTSSNITSIPARMEVLQHTSHEGVFGTLTCCIRADSRFLFILEQNLYINLHTILFSN